MSCPKNPKDVCIWLSQLKRTGNQVLLKGGTLEDAITAAITAMNEPKTCSTTTLRRYLLDANKDRKEYQLGKTPRVSCLHYWWLSHINYMLGLFQRDG